MMPISESHERRLDHVCQDHTAFKSFAELVNDHPGYRPSCDMSEGWAVELADAYDATMQARGDTRRAYRYGYKTFTAGDHEVVWSNQARRPANVLAVLDEGALLEYEMPKGTTALVIMRGFAGDNGKYVGYRTLTAKWVRAIREQGQAGAMIGKGQSREVWSVPATGDKLVGTRRAR